MKEQSQTTNLDDHSRTNLFNDIFSVIIKVTGDQPSSYEAAERLVEMLDNNEWLAHD